MTNVLVVYKRSSYEILSANRTVFAKLRRRSPKTFRDLKLSHETHLKSLEKVCRVITDCGHVCRREDRARMDRVAWADLVVTVGGDGTLLEASHYVTETPVLAVNSDPQVSVAHFSACKASNFAKVYRGLGTRDVPLRRVSRLAVSLDKKPLRYPILNDLLLAHRNPAATTRLTLKYQRRQQTFKCSGVWVSTAAGSTAGIGSAGGWPMPVLSRRWQYLVREPYRHQGDMPSKKRMTLKDRLQIVCGIESARLYLDGPHGSVRIGIGSQIDVSPTAPDLKLYRSIGS